MVAESCVPFSEDAQSVGLRCRIHTMVMIRTASQAGDEQMMENKAKNMKQVLKSHDRRCRLTAVIKDPTTRVRWWGVRWRTDGQPPSLAVINQRKCRRTERAYTFRVQSNLSEGGRRRAAQEHEGLKLIVILDHCFRTWPVADRSHTHRDCRTMDADKQGIGNTKGSTAHD